jgi:hypothetical protein
MAGEPDRGTALESRPVYPGTPRWVKLVALAALALVVLAVVMMVVLGGNHGPMRHLPPTGLGAATTLLIALPT